MRLPLLILLLVVIAGPSLSQDWALRADDERLDAAALEGAITGRELVFYDDGRSRFSAGGSYSYTYSAVNGGGSQFGIWRVADDGIICIAYRNGQSRCDMYVRADGRFVVLTEDGGRFPVRPDG